MLHIISAKPGCGCTSVRAPKELLPGKPAQIMITYDTEGPTGAIHKGLTIAFAESPDNPLRLTIIGKVHEEIRLAPANLMLGVLDGNDTRTFSFTANRLDKKPLSIQLVDLPLSVHATTTNISPNTVLVSGILTAPRLPNDYTDTLHIRTNDTALPLMNARLSYNVRPRFIVEPKIANFGAIHPDAKPEILLAIRGNARVRLQSIPRGIHARLIETKSNSGNYTLTVLLAGQGEGKILSERLILATDDPKQPRISVPVYAVSKR